MPSAWRFKELPTAAGRRGGLYPPLPQLCGVVWRAEVVAPHKQRSTRGASGKPRPTIEGKPGSATTPRRPPAQAAKKVGIEPRRFPVPPAESPVDGAGPQWGRKDGPPDNYLESPNPLGSPFFFGFQKPFLFPAGKKKWVLNRLPRPFTSQKDKETRRNTTPQGSPSSVWPSASHHGSRKKSFLLTVHRTVRPPGEGSVCSPSHR